MKTCKDCYWFNKQYIRPRCLDYDEPLCLDERSNPVPLLKCIIHQEQEAAMRKNASTAIKSAFGIDKALLHFSEVKS